MIATGWTWPAVVVVVVIIASFTLVAVASMASRFARTPIAGPGLASGRLEAIEDELTAIRADLSEIKATISELDRMFKSVG